MQELQEELDAKVQEQKDTIKEYDIAIEELEKVPLSSLPFSWRPH